MGRVQSLRQIPNMKPPNSGTLREDGKFIATKLPTTIPPNNVCRGIIEARLMSSLRFGCGRTMNFVVCILTCRCNLQPMRTLFAHLSRQGVLRGVRWRQKETQILIDSWTWWLMFFGTWDCTGNMYIVAYIYQLRCAQCIYIDSDMCDDTYIPIFILAWYFPFLQIPWRRTP